MNEYADWWERNKEWLSKQPRVQEREKAVRGWTDREYDRAHTPYSNIGGVNLSPYAFKARKPTDIRPPERLDLLTAGGRLPAHLRATRRMPNLNIWGRVAGLRGSPVNRALDRQQNFMRGQRFAAATAPQRINMQQALNRGVGGPQAMQQGIGQDFGINQQRRQSNVNYLKGLMQTGREFEGARGRDVDRLVRGRDIGSDSAIKNFQRWQKARAGEALGEVAGTSGGGGGGGLLDRIGSMFGLGRRK